MLKNLLIKALQLNDGQPDIRTINMYSRLSKLGTSETSNTHSTSHMYSISSKCSIPSTSETSISANEVSLEYLCSKVLPQQLKQSKQQLTECTNELIQEINHKLDELEDNVKQQCHALLTRMNGQQTINDTYPNQIHSNTNNDNHPIGNVHLDVMMDRLSELKQMYMTCKQHRISLERLAEQEHQSAQLDRIITELNER